MNMLATSFVLVAILGAEDQPAAKMPLGKETTYFTGPLDKEGYVDYQAALNERLGQGITSKTNANVLLWKVFGPTPEGKRMPAEFFKLLGIDEPPPEGNYLIGLPTYLKDHAKLESSEVNVVLQRQLVRTMARPWKAKDYPHIAAWLAANEKPLALAIEATRRPDYFNPLVTERSEENPGLLIAALLPGVQRSREIARALAARAMLRVGEEKFDEAWQDLLACHRLGRLLARGATLIEALVGIALDGIASNADLAFLERAKLMPDQDRLKDLQSLPPFPPMADKIDFGERILFLDSFQHVRRGRSTATELSGEPAKKPTAAELKALDRIDWAPPLRSSNRWYDRMAAAMRVKDFAVRQKELAKIDEDLKALKQDTTGVQGFAKLLLGAVAGKGNGESIGNILIQLMLPAVGAAQNAEDRAEQIQRNLQVAFALAAYHRDHQRYPDKLDNLAPKYLATIPIDLFAGKPLVYLTADKGYLLYSVGVNGKDEEGRWYDDEPRGDDPNVRMPLPELKQKKE